MEELKRCPFCKGPAETVAYERNATTGQVVDLPNWELIREKLVYVSKSTNREHYKRTWKVTEYITRCQRPRCPGHNAVKFQTPEEAETAWNQRTETTSNPETGKPATEK